MARVGATDVAYDLADEMLRCEWSDRDLALVFGGNFRRLLAGARS